MTAAPLGATDPTTGTAVNSLTPASFNGTSDYLRDFTDTWDALASSSAWSMWALIKPAATAAAGANPYDGDGILTDGSGSAAIGMVLTSDGITAYHYDGTVWPNASAAAGVGSWLLAQAKYDGTNIKVRVNGGAWASSAANNAAALTGAALRVGASWNAARFLNGDALDLAIANTALSDATFDSVRSYCLATYGVTV